jgi:predicted DNA-binding transcriptional regulator AlpA
MPSTARTSAFDLAGLSNMQVGDFNSPNPLNPKPPARSNRYEVPVDPLLTVDDVARRLNVSRDWVWDHSSRKVPRLPVIRMGDGTLRYRANKIEDFISEQERLSMSRLARR